MNEMRRAGWVEGESFADVRRFARDAYGNVTAWLDADGRRTEIDYDVTRHQFPVEERHFPNENLVLRFELDVDPASGQASFLHTEPDGATTRYTWDGLGRLASVERPTDPAGDPAEKLTYALGPGERSLTRARRSIFLADALASMSLLSTSSMCSSASARERAARSKNPAQLCRLEARDLRCQRKIAVQAFGPYFAASAVAVPPSGTGVTEDFRDPLGRPLHRALPAGGELLWVEGPGFEDRYDALASAGQAEASRVFLDWQGRVGAVKLDPGGNHERVFAFARDAAGRVVARTSPAGAGMSREVSDAARTPHEPGGS